MYDSDLFIDKLYGYGHPKLDAISEDKLSTNLIPETVKANMKALRSTADGNCLFNSVSLFLSGTEDLAIELRLRTCLELARNVNYYKQYPKYADLLIPSLSGDGSYQSIEEIYDVVAFLKESSEVFELSKDFDAAAKNEIMETVCDHKACTTLPIMALSTVIGSNIETVYPEQNYLYTSAYQNIFQPRGGATHSRNDICLLRTSTRGWPDYNKEFSPNHFVPLVPKPTPPSISMEPTYDTPLYKVHNSTKRQKDKDVVHMEVIDEDENQIPVTLTDQEENNLCSGDDSYPPLSMPIEWYGQIGRVATGNQARDQQRKERKQMNCFIEESSLDANFKAKRQHKRNVVRIIKIFRTKTNQDHKHSLK